MGYFPTISNLNIPWGAESQVADSFGKFAQTSSMCPNVSQYVPMCPSEWLCALSHELNTTKPVLSCQHWAAAVIPMWFPLMCLSLPLLNLEPWVEGEQSFENVWCVNTALSLNLLYLYVYIYTYIIPYTYIYIYIHLTVTYYTSSTAQGGGGSFKNRKPIGEVGCCESGMAERNHWWTERWLRSPLFLSLSLTIYLPTYLCMYLSIYLPIYLSICLSIYRSIDLWIYRSIDLSIYRSIYLSIDLSIYLSIYLSVYLSICVAVSFSVM